MSKTKAQIEQVDRDIREHTKDIEALMANKGKLEGKLESEKKPELRHGDYGIHESDGEEFLLTLQSSQDKFYYSDTGGQIDALNHADNHTVLGNIFDDLKAMQDDVTGFETSHEESKFSVHVNFDEDDIAITDDDNGCVFIEKRKIPQFIKGLRQMEATIQRSKK